jgi:hypothetical protein
LWHILDASHLKSLYCLDRLQSDDGTHIKDKQFIREFCNYFGRASPCEPGLWASLSRVSYRLTVWELVPNSLTAEEMEEMEYELGYEEVPIQEMHHITAEYHEVWGFRKPDWMPGTPPWRSGLGCF